MGRIVVLLIFLLTVPPNAAAMEEAEDAPVTLEQCQAQLLSGDFVVTDSRKDHRPLPQVARKLAKSIQEIIEKGKKGGPERFDRQRAEVLHHVIDGRWVMSETSEDILDDCFFAVHPDAELAE